MKKLRNATIFILIFLIVFVLINKVLRITPNSIYYFYKEPKNSLDVVYVGSSNVYVYFNSVLAYKEHGFTTGLMASDTQPIQILKDLIKETHQYQNPKVYVIDLGHIHHYNDFDIGAMRKIIDEMPLSFNKLDITKKLLKEAKIEKKDYINYYFSFLTYHSSWKYLSKEKIYNSHLYKGYLLDELTISIEPNKKVKWNYEISYLNEAQKNALNDTIKYVKDNNLKVLFTVPIKVYDMQSMGYINEAVKIIENNNLKIINFNTISDIDINYTHDLYNSNHLNVWGATKFTRYFAAYLDKNYNLPDHRGAKKYQSWDKEYIRFTKNLKELTGENIKNM